MLRRIALALAFVAAIGAAGVGMTSEADAHGGYFGRSIGYGGIGYGVVPIYGSGYQSAAVRMGAYGPTYPVIYSNYGYGYGGYPVNVRRVNRYYGGHGGHRGHNHGGISIRIGF